ncbi:hypothetical protein POTOM_062159 [Populus tomentosa]|uniref:Uncharacterized protein n=1 Tax=Populus tomentosa TaxID=118781 RepID=A0A8X7XP84_POPTO|nr:hypothetical protein POTOM_062159 [Populus tomentosa]
MIEQLDDSYLGCERWLPSRPKVEKPPSVFNAATLAYIDDSIFEIIYTRVSKMMQLYARRHFLFPPSSLEEHNDCVIAVVCCEAQPLNSISAFVNPSILGAWSTSKIPCENFKFSTLSKDDDGTSKIEWKERLLVGIQVKCHVVSWQEIGCSSLGKECWLSLPDKCKSFGRVMLTLGFSTGSSTQMIMEEANSYDVWGKKARGKLRSHYVANDGRVK